MSEPELIPAKWNVIIQHSNREYERVKSLEKQRQQQRKLAYRQALDDSLREKQMLAHDDKLEDRRIYESMIQKNRTLDQLEQQKKLQFQKKAKEVTNQNKKRSSQTKDNSFLQKEGERSLASIQIGNPQEDSLRRHTNKKELLEFYAKHIEDKKQRERMEKEQDKEMIAKQQMIQLQREKQRENQRKRILNHGQDANIFRYYNSLNQLGHIRQRQLEAKLIEEAARQKQQKEDQRTRLDVNIKNHLMDDVRKSLLEQMAKHKEMKIEEKRNRSEERNVNMFEGEIKNGNAYNKQDYLAILLKQEQMARKRKQDQKNMNALEYQMNLQDLKKAVSGGHVYNSSPLYIGYSDEQQVRKDNIYFNKLASPKSSSQTNRTHLPPEDSLDEFQKRLDRGVINKLKPGSRENQMADFPLG